MQGADAKTGKRTKLFLVFFLVLHLVPIWIFRYFQTQDGPTHLYNTVVLSQFTDHSNYLTRGFYRFNSAVFPNWTYSLMGVALLHLFTPLITEKIILSVVVGFFVLSFFYCCSSISGKLRAFSLVGFLFSYNYLLIMGFFNFLLSCGFLFIALGFWYRNRDSLSFRSVGIIYVLLILMFLSHVYPLFFFLFSSSFILIVRTLRNRHLWRPGSKPFFRRAYQKFKPFLEWTFVMLPAWFIFLSDAFKRVGEPSYNSFSSLLNYFLHFRSLELFSNFRFDWGSSVFILFSGGAIATAIHWIKNAEARDDSIDFLLLVAPLLFMYFYLPWGYGSHGWTSGGWGNERVHLLLFLLIVPWLNVDFHPVLRKVFVALLIALSAIHLGWLVIDIARIQPEIEAAQAVCQKIPEHSTFSGAGQSIHPVVADYLSPAYCGLGTSDLVFVDNYEAGLDYFPLMWKSSPPTPEYKIIWNKSAGQVDPENHYDVIAQNKYCLLLKLKSDSIIPINDTPPPLGFDLEPQPGLTPNGYISAGEHSIYRSGGFGWLTDLQSPIRGRVRTQNNDAGMLIGDYLGAREDGVFIATLPNGAYKISSFFFSGDGGSHVLAVIANDQLVIPKLNIPAGQYRKVVYEVSVFNNRLVQVIYSLQKGSRDLSRHDHWIWSGFSIKPSD